MSRKACWSARPTPRRRCSSPTTWCSAPTGRQRENLSVRVRAARATLVALSAETGKKLWECDTVEGFTSSAEVLVVDGKVWTGDSLKHQKHDFRTVRDLHTGEVIQTYPESDDWFPYHHYRCYPTKATVRYLLSSRHGIEYTDLETGELTPHDYIRGICRYGVLPCNGLLYLPPDQCACDNLGKLVGFYAVAPKPDFNRPSSIFPTRPGSRKGRPSEALERRSPSRPVQTTGRPIVMTVSAAGGRPHRSRRPSASNGRRSSAASSARSSVRTGGSTSRRRIRTQ